MEGATPLLLNILLAEMSHLKTGVIVLGGHVQGYGIVRIYGENGIPSVVIDSTKCNIARHSKYCLGFFKTGYDNLVNSLIDIGRDYGYGKWLLIPTDDYYVRILSQNKQKLEKYFTLSVDDWDTVRLFFDKRNSYPLAEAAGVPIPKTLYPTSINDLDAMCGKIQFPCIIKPAVMLDFYRHFKKKVFLCRTAEELFAKYRYATEVLKPDELLIQEIIPGSSDNQYSVGLFFDRDKSYNHLVARRKRQHPLDFGNATTFAETVDLPVLIDYSHKILSNARFQGLCEVEFKFDIRDGEYKFLEVNPRTWKWHLISESARVPFLMSLYNFFFENRPIVSKDAEDAGWRDLLTDIPVVLRLLLKGLFTRSHKAKVTQAVLNFKDPNPFLFQLFYLPYLAVKR